MNAKHALLVACVVLSAPALADERLVLGDSVNLRAGPGADKPILLRLDRGARVQQIDAAAEWIRVESPEPAAPVGWIHASLLSSPAFARFKRTFDYRNARARELTGETFFERVEERERGVLRVQASPVWLAQPEPGRLENLRYILWIWSEAQPTETAGAPLTVRVVDAEGAERMAISGKAGEPEQ